MAQPLIAVVNNDLPFLDLMKELLTEEGYRVILHHEGDTAYALIRKEQPDLVILDIRLEYPEAGWTVLDLIQLDPETTHIPVILCSADPTPPGEGGGPAGSTLRAAGEAL
jgi:CheY-like chemotaxis protein